MTARQARRGVAHDRPSGPDGQKTQGVLTFAALGRLVVRRRKLVLALTGVFLILAAVVGGGIFERLKSGGFLDPNAESAEAEELLDDQFAAGQPDLVLLVEVDGGDVDAPEAVAAAPTAPSGWPPRTT